MYEVVPGAGQRDWHLGKRVIFSPISWFTTAGRRIQVGVKTAAAGGHGGFGRHLLSNLLSSLDERNEEEDKGERGRWKRCVEWKKKEKDGRRNWNTDGKLLDEKPSLMYALHGCIMYYTDRETFFRNISLLSGLRGSFHSVSRFFVMLGSSASAFSAVHINSGLRFIKASKNICRLRSHPQNFAKPTWRLRRARDCATDCSKILPWITRKRSTTNIFDSGNYKSLPIKWIYRLVSGFALEGRSSWSLWLGWSLKGGNMLVPRQKVGYTGLWCLYLVSFFFFTS